MEESKKDSNSAKNWGITSFILSFFFPLVAIATGIVSMIKGKGGKDKTYFAFSLAGIIVASINVTIRFILIIVMIILPVKALTYDTGHHDVKHFKDDVYHTPWDMDRHMKDDEDGIRDNDNNPFINPSCKNVTAPNEWKDMGWNGAIFIVACEVLGMSESDAVSYIKDKGYLSRIAARDDESYPLTMDYRSDRINLYMRNGNVINATVG